MVDDEAAAPNCSTALAVRRTKGAPKNFTRAEIECDDGTTEVGDERGIDGCKVFLCGSDADVYAIMFYGGVALFVPGRFMIEDFPLLEVLRLILRKATSEASVLYSVPVAVLHPRPKGTRTNRKLKTEKAAARRLTLKCYAVCWRLPA
jgi:hypothetical protein